MPCRHPRDQRLTVRAGEFIADDRYILAPEDGYSCGKCHRFVPKSKSLQGKRANRRGRTESARIAKAIGGVNHEVESRPYDVSTDLYLVQSKKDNNLFSERIWKLLNSISTDARVPVLIVKDAPGPGKSVRGYAVLKYEDWVDTTGVTSCS